MATLSQLPHELLLIILTDPDVQLDVELCHLAGLSHRFNVICIPIFLSIHGISKPEELVDLNIPCSGEVPTNGDPLLGLATSLYITQVKELRCTFPYHCKLKPYLRDLRRLAGVVKRLHGMEKFNLQLEAFCVIPQASTEDLAHSTARVEEWAEALQELLNAVIAQPLIEFTIHDGGAPLSSLYPSSPQTSFSPKPQGTLANSLGVSQIKNKIYRILSRPSRDKPSPPSPRGITFRAPIYPPEQALLLSDVELGGSMVLLQPCLSWTLSLLWHASSTLTTLSLKGVRFTEPESERWKQLLIELHEPLLSLKALESLSFEDCHGLPARALSRFLRGLTTIKRLSFVESVTPAITPPRFIPTYQNLEYLRAPHDILRSLTGGNPLPFLNSARVDLRPTFLAPGELLTIHCVGPTLNVVKKCSSVTVQVPFTRYGSRLLRWDLDWVDTTHRKRFELITELILEDFGLELGKDHTRAVFVEWLGLFKNLKRVEIKTRKADSSDDEDETQSVNARQKVDILAAALQKDDRGLKIEKLVYDDALYDMLQSEPSLDL
ncbi:hypothetical protein BDN72DRAFT_836469 [Pluteus cervinus]|uniref:Uncharacterized protein n=1 Tax=Pluteus cervinus TaxID=181527 RepID=A0ACD3B5Q5_9AGAR|nr:hypothetical protein BDN72DRAFT_836469 [Pluteus cervinus]